MKPGPWYLNFRYQRWKTKLIEHELPSSSVFPPAPAEGTADTRATTAEEGVAGVVDRFGGLCKVLEESNRCRLKASATSSN